MSLGISAIFEHSRDVESFRITQAREESIRLNVLNDEQLGKQGLGSVIKSGAAENIAVSRDAQIIADEENKKNATEVQLLLQLQRRLDGLYEARNVANEELANIRENKAALEDLRKMYEDGTLDPDNEEHQKVMKKAGITREDLMKDPTGAFDRQAKFWDDREQNKIKEIEGIDRDIAKTQKIVDASPEQRRELLRASDESIVDATIATDEIEQNIVTEALDDKGYSEDGKTFQANAAQNGLFGNSDFESNDTSASTKSFASTLDMGEPPAMLNLSTDFDVAANAPAPSVPLPVLDLSSEFKFQ